MTAMKREATISHGGVYRYRLGRLWEPTPTRRVLFVMLNPSTADALKDDPTVRRCIGFAKRDGAGEMVIVNLFAYRTSDPLVLWQAHRAGTNVVGEENDDYISVEAVGAHRIVLAYGVLRSWALSREQRVLDILREWAGRTTSIDCLGLTRDGYPKHPVRLANATPFESFQVGLR